MKADTSRSSFDPIKHYRTVVRQQGRVDLDADWNEQQEIADHLRTATTLDLVGAAGGPAAGGGFAVTVAAQDLLLSAGSYYVDGLLASNEAPVSVWEQPDVPANSRIVRLGDGSDVAGPKPPPGRYLVYLDVWDLHRTALEDGEVREVALGGPDSTTRVKTVWQAKLLRMGDVGIKINCTSVTPAWTALTAAPTGLLEARAEPADAASGPCVVPSDAGFRGLENQHYRVEVHRSGSTGTATFKWARDNAAVVASWVSGPDPGGVITVASPGRDSATGFATGQTVELIDDTRELLGLPGTLVQLSDVRGNRLTITPAAGVNLADYPVRPRVRRWDSPGAITVDRPADSGGWLDLEQGVQIRFAKDSSYPTGAYWLIPARAVLTDILWPRVAGLPVARPPQGIDHHFARLALVSFDGTSWLDPHDCRTLFPHLTELMQVHAVSGDGQTVLPPSGIPGATVPLPQPIVAAVSNGSLPVAGAGLKFTVQNGAGTVDGVGTKLATTDVNGLASVSWAVDAVTDVQQVRVDLLDDGKKPFGTPAGFTASLLTAARTAYLPTQACPDLAGATTVQQAIDLLCQRTTPALPRVIKISWQHAGEMVVDEFIEKGLEIIFDAPMKPPEGSPVAWFVVTVEYDRRDFEGDPTEIFVRRINALEVAFEDGGQLVRFRPFQTFKQWVKQAPILPDEVLCRVVLKSHVLLDEQGRALDGDFIGANLPSGNGVPGGDFESWLTLTKVRG